MNAFAGLMAFLLLLPLGVQAAFFSRDDGLLREVRDEVSYRPAAAATIWEEVARQQDGWTSQARQPFEVPKGPIDLWARFDLPRQEAERRILIAASRWERVEYFLVLDGKLIARRFTGTLVPESQRTGVQITMVSTIAGDFVTVELPAAAQVTVYAHLKSEQRFAPVTSLKFTLWDFERVLDGERHDRIMQGIYFGIVMLLVMYNLGLFLVESHEPGYLYFAANMLLSGGLFGAYNGVIGELFWRESPWYDYYTLWLAAPAGASALVLFVRRYLDTPVNYPRLDRYLKIVALVAVLPFVVNASAGGIL